MTKTIAITGATGFAGRHAVGALLARGYRLKALVRRPVSAGLPDGVTLIEGGLNSEAALRDLMQGVDAVVHLAGAISGLSRGHYFEVNGRGTAAVVAAAERAGVKRLVLTHISARYNREAPELVDEARAIFPAVSIARDGMAVDVPFPDQTARPPSASR